MFAPNAGASNTPRIRCPYCQSPYRQVKWGHTPAGSQKYRCHACCRVYTPARKFNGYTEEIRRAAVEMYQRGHKFRHIARLLGVHHQSVVNWVHRRTA